mgnify:CR=1 FL=1
MSKVHGIVYAYHSSPRLGDLTRYRTNASLPFCGRYRLIDFALSSLSNAGKSRARQHASGALEALQCARCSPARRLGSPTTPKC